MRIENLLNLCLLLFSAVLIAFWSFWRFGAEFSLADTANWQNMPTLGEEFVADSLIKVQKNKRDAFYIFPGSSVTLAMQDENNLNLSLHSGEILVSALAGDFNLQIDNPELSVNSYGSVFHLSRNEEDGKSDLRVFSGPLLLTLREEGRDLNALFVPTNHKIAVHDVKLKPNLALLQLAKLSKEFPVFLISEQDKEPELNEILSDLNANYSEFALQFENSFSARSAFKGAFYFNLSELADKWLGVLTFSAKVRLADMEQKSLNSLLDSISLFFAGQNEMANASMEKWMSSRGESSLSFEEQLFKDLFWVLPGHAIYPVKEALAKLLYEDDPLAYLHFQHSQVEKLLAKSDVLNLKPTYLGYMDFFKKSLSGGVFEESGFSDDLAREYVLLELLLRSSSGFYSLENFTLLAEVEAYILNQIEDEAVKNEQYQVFVQSHLRFMVQIRNSVETEKLSPTQGADLSEELLAQAEEYFDALNPDVAVVSYFRKALDEAANSIGFMKSPEFYAYLNFEEGMAAYTAKAEDLSALDSYLADLRSGGLAEDNESELSLEDAMYEVGVDLSANKISYSSLESQNDAAYRLFEIKGARLASVPFTAFYDRETRILYDVEFLDLRFPSGIRLEDAESFVNEIVKNEDPEDGVSDSGVEDPGAEDLAKELSPVEKLALQKVENAFEAAGIDYSQLVFSIVDLEGDVFSFDGIVGAFEISVSGQYSLADGKISELTWQYEGEAKSLPNLGLEQFLPSLEATYSAFQALKML